MSIASINHTADRAYAPGEPCPHCGKPMTYDDGERETRSHPGMPPSVGCDDCGDEYAVRMNRTIQSQRIRDQLELARESDSARIYRDAGNAFEKEGNLEMARLYWRHAANQQHYAARAWRVANS